MFTYMYPNVHRGLYGGDWSFLFSPGGIIMGITFLVLIGLVIYFAVTRRKQDGGRYSYSYDRQPASLRQPDDTAAENPEAIVKTRYAKGEISREEMTEILKNLR